MLKNGFFTHIAQYLNITSKLLSGARNVLETPNLDQRYLVGVSRSVQRDFWKFPFFTHFLGAAGEKIVTIANFQNGDSCSLHTNSNIKSHMLRQEGGSDLFRGQKTS